MKVAEAFKFCPRCGKEIHLNKDFLECPACGLHYYLNPKPAAGIIPVNEHGEILLVERAEQPGKGLWDIVGGFLQEGETLEEGAIRETKEELGLAVEPGELTYVASYKHSYLYQGIEYATTTVCFRAKIDSGIGLQPADDVASYKFFKPADLPFEKLAFPEQIPILKSL